MKKFIITTIITLALSMGFIGSASANEVKIISGKVTTCSVRTTCVSILGIWIGFEVKYNFQDSNRDLTFQCAGLLESDDPMSKRSGPIYECFTRSSGVDKWSYKSDFMFKLPRGTSGAEKFICDRFPAAMGLKYTP